jgi:hypothetical protein
MLVIWAIPAIFLSSLIGVSQTEISMPRILKKYLELEYVENGNPQTRNWKGERRPSTYERAWRGGMSSHRPERWNMSTLAKSSFRAETARWSWFHSTMAFLIVLSGTISAWFLTACVPPQIFSCRQIAQSSTMWLWLPSTGIQYLIVKWAENRDERKKWAVRILLAKDLFISLAVLDVILITQWGVMNRSG